MLKYVMTMALGLVMVCAQQAAGQGDWGNLISGAVKTLSDAAKDTGLIKESSEAAKESAKEAAKSVKDSCEKQDDTRKKTSKKKSAKGDMSKVAAALEEAGYFTDKKAKPKAQYYIFICSASWCPPCRKLMPSIVKTYKQEISKDDRVDLILLGGDNNEAKCAEYLKHYKAKFPGLHAKKKIDLPDFPAIQYWPFAIFVDADGKVITTGHGSKVLEWKKQLPL